MKYIFGLNKSGLSILNYLDKINEEYCCWDDNKQKRDRLINKKKNINLLCPEDLDFDLVSESFVTPGVSLKDKKIKILKKNKIKLFRDLELYSRLAVNKKTIAITGTNGKSTTTKLISEILNKGKINNFIGGNFGIPLLDFVRLKDDAHYHVVELSSFQLESFNTFNPFISILLNIEPDHLDRYKNFKEYISQKEKIIKFSSNKYNIMSIDSKITKSIYKKYEEKIIPISNKQVKKGIYYNDTKIIDNYFDKKINILLDNISPSLFGLFNMQNIVAAYIVTRILKIDIKHFKYVISNFRGLPHRLEEIYKNNKFQVINNSKATNVSASIKSVLNYKNIYLILGGRAKEKDFKNFLILKKRIKRIYLIGESSSLIFQQLNKEINCEIHKDINSATKKIMSIINNDKSYSTILFAPACTSYDQFLNFEKRGNCFKKEINKAINE